MERAAGSTSSTEKRAAAPPTRVLAGRVVGAHGLRGQLRIRVEGGEQSLLAVPQLWLAARGEAERRHEVVSASAGRPGEVRVRLADVADRDGAERLRGAEIWIEAAQLGELAPGEYWTFQLVGCEVEDGAGRRLGSVREIRNTGAQDLLVVEGADGVQHLIPAVQEWWREVDLERRRIVVELPPGLLDPA